MIWIENFGKTGLSNEISILNSLVKFVKCDQSFISVKYRFLDTEQPSSCFSVKYRYWILLVCLSITEEEEEAVCYYCGGTQRTFPEEKKAFYLFVLAFWHPCQAVKSQRAKSNSKSEI